MGTPKINIQLIPDITSSGEVTFRLRYTQRGKVLKNEPIPDIKAPAAIKRSDFAKGKAGYREWQKAKLQDPYYHKAWLRLEEAKKNIGQKLKEPSQRNFNIWAINQIEQIAPGSQDAFKCFVRFLQKFTERENIEFSMITPQLCIEFQTYIHSKLAYNTACNRFKKFMQYVRRAKAAGLVTGDFSGIRRIQKFECYEVGPTLTEEQIKTLFGIPCSVLQVELISKFQYYSYQRISDVLALTWDMLKKRGDRYIIPLLIQKKTGNKVHNITLDSDLVEQVPGERKGKLFKKFCGNDHYKTLDEWSDIEGIELEKDDKVRSHVFRRSAATHAFNAGIRIDKISKVLGHVNKAGIPNILQTMQYINIPMENMEVVFDTLREVTKKNV